MNTINWGKIFGSGAVRRDEENRTVHELRAKVEHLTVENDMCRKALLNVLPKLETQNRNGINWYHDICQINEALGTKS